MNDVVYVMVNSKLKKKREGVRRSFQEFEYFIRWWVHYEKMLKEKTIKIYI